MARSGEMHRQALAATIAENKGRDPYSGKYIGLSLDPGDTYSRRASRALTKEDGFTERRIPNLHWDSLGFIVWK